jgi:Transcription factor WhiB
MELQVNDQFDNWTKDAACKGMDTNLFYADHGKKYAKVRLICESCPVFAQCLQWALTSESEGMWAGTTELERVVMRKQMKIDLVRPEDFYDASKSVCGTNKGYVRHAREARAQGKRGPNLVKCQPCLEAHRIKELENYCKRTGKSNYVGEWAERQARKRSEQ